MRILIAEDQRSFALQVERALRAEGHAVTLVPNGQEALRLGRTAEFDLILLDVMLPRINGLDVIRSLRQERTSVQTMMVSARDSIQDIINGLDAGADDYLTKPFPLDVLLAKVRAAERRIPQSRSESLSFADLVLEAHAYEARRGERTVPLTRTECALLEILLRRPRQVVPHQALIEGAWGPAADVSFDSLYVFIRTLRSKITHSGEVELLHTVRGVGYCLRAEH